MRRWCSYVVLTCAAGAAMAGNPPPSFMMVTPPSTQQMAWLDPDGVHAITPMVLANAWSYSTTGDGWLSGTAVAQYVTSQIISRRNGV